MSRRWFVEQRVTIVLIAFWLAALFVFVDQGTKMSDRVTPQVDAVVAAAGATLVKPVSPFIYGDRFMTRIDTPSGVSMQALVSISGGGVVDVRILARSEGAIHGKNASLTPESLDVALTILAENVVKKAEKERLAAEEAARKAAEKEDAK